MITERHVRTTELSQPHVAGKAQPRDDESWGGEPGSPDSELMDVLCSYSPVDGWSCMWPICTNILAFVLHRHVIAYRDGDRYLEISVWGSKRSQFPFRKVKSFVKRFY